MFFSERRARGFVQIVLKKKTRTSIASFQSAPAFHVAPARQVAPPLLLLVMATPAPSRPAIAGATTTNAATAGLTPFSCSTSDAKSDRAFVAWFNALPPSPGGALRFFDRKVSLVSGRDRVASIEAECESIEAAEGRREARAKTKEKALIRWGGGGRDRNADADADLTLCLSLPLSLKKKKNTTHTGLLHPPRRRRPARRARARQDSWGRHPHGGAAE